MATVVDKSLLEAVRKATDAALVAVAQAHGLKSLSCGKCVYDPRAGNFTFKLEGIAEGALDKDAARYDQMAELLSLPPLGSSFRHSGKVHKTVGLNTTGTKVITERDDGKRFIWPVDTCKALCKAFAS